MTFSFASRDGAHHQIRTRTHRVETLTDDAHEWLMYDPQEPDRAVMLDSLPGRFAVSPSGDFASADPLAPVAVLLLPAGCLFVNWLMYVNR